MMQALPKDFLGLLNMALPRTVFVRLLGSVPFFDVVRDTKILPSDKTYAEVQLA